MKSELGVSGAISALATSYPLKYCCATASILNFRRYCHHSLDFLLVESEVYVDWRRSNGKRESRAFNYLHLISDASPGTSVY